MTTHPIDTVHRSYKYSKNFKKIAQDVQKSVIWGVITAWLEVRLKCIHMVEQQLQLYCLLKYSV